MAIKYRQELGRPLTYAEGDENFRTLEDSIEKTLAEYPTLTVAMADDIPDGVVFIIKDGDENEGIWRRDSSLPEGAEFLRGLPASFSDVFTRAKYKRGKNLFNKNNTVEGITGDGGIVPNGDYETATIPIIGLRKTFTLTGVRKFIGLDIKGEKSKTENTIPDDLGSPTTVVMSDNCAFIQASVRKTLLDVAQIEVGSTQTDYEPFKMEVVSEAGDLPYYASKEVEAEVQEIQSVFREVPELNLIDKDALTANTSFNPDTMSLQEEAGMYITDFIPVKKGRWYRRTGFPITRPIAGFASKDAEPIMNLGWGHHFYISEDSDVNYIVATLNAGSRATAQITEGMEEHPYTPFATRKVIAEESLEEEYLTEKSLPKVVLSNQHFNGKYIDKAALSSSGDYINESEGSLVTFPIAIPSGEEFVTVSGLLDTDPQPTRRLRFLDHNGLNIGAYGIFGTSGTFEIPENAKFVQVWFKHSTESDLAGLLSTFMVNFGETILEKDEYEVGLYTSAEDKPQSSSEILRIDQRYVDNLEIQRLAKETEKYKNTLNSLRKIKATGAGEKAVHIPNHTGEEIKDAVIVLNLHHGSGTSTPSDIFMDGECAEDFSDIRFLDTNDQLLDFYKGDSGNYEIVPDTGDAKLEFIALSDGSFVGTDYEDGRDGVNLSEDNLQTWTNIKETGKVVGRNQFDDIFYQLDNDLYKTTKASGYTDSTLVMEGAYANTRFRSKSFKMDDANYLYCAQYQNEFDILLFKSTDDGDSWTRILTGKPQQHIHSLTLNRETVPNTIYVNCDGNMFNETSFPRTYKSTDRGVTFEALPYESDGGVLYAENKFRLGGGEASIKGFYSINKTVDDTVFKPVLDVAQTVFVIQKLGDAFYATGSIHTTNRTLKIYRSTDEGETWKAIFDTGYRVESDMSASYRYGLFEPVIPKGATEEQIILRYNYGNVKTFPSIRIFDGGNHHQGLFYVKVPVLPAAGLDIKIGYGYLAEDLEGDLFNDSKPDDLSIHFPLNEYGRFVRDNSGKTYDLGDNTDWISGKTKRYGWLVPFKTPPVTAAVKFPDNGGLQIRNNVDADLNFNKNFTVNFWMKVEDYHIDPNDKGFICGRNNLFFSRHNTSRIYLNYGTSNAFVKFMIHPVMARTPFMMTFVVTDDQVPTLKIYQNGGYQGEVELTGFDDSISYGDWFLGGKNGDQSITKSEESFFTDFSIYKTALSDEEILRLYEGTKIIRPV